MGRTKSIPIKRCVGGTQSGDGDNDEDDVGDHRQRRRGQNHHQVDSKSWADAPSSSFIAGRIVHPDWNVLATEELLTGERGEWFSRRHVVMTTTNNSEATNDNNNDDNNNSRKRHKNRIHPTGDEDHVLVQSSSEDEDDDHEILKSRRRLKRRRLRKSLPITGRRIKHRASQKYQRVVRFASTMEFIEAPEIMVEECDANDIQEHNHGDGNTEIQATLWYQPSASDEQNQEVIQQKSDTPNADISKACDSFVLKSFELQKTRLCRPVMDEDKYDTLCNSKEEGNSRPATTGGLVCSSLGIRHLLQYCNQRHCQLPNLKQQTDAKYYYDCLIDAIQSGLMHLSVEPDHPKAIVRVSLSLTTDALRLCCPPFCRQPSTLAASFVETNSTKNDKNIGPTRRFGKKRTKLETVLQKALAVLLPDTVIEDVVAPRSNDLTGKRKANSDVITAKTVYELVDNVRLHQYFEHNRPKQDQLRIPGLIPTLRPYQQAAVEWMLQREKKGGVSDEWELAWVVLTSGGCQAKPDGSDASSAYTSVHALPEWKSLPKSAPHQSTILYSPFFGWLASSWQQAKVMSIGIVSNGNGVAQGGILADSMGLGKTVEVLACMLAHPRPQEDLITHRQHENLTSTGPRRLIFPDEAEEPEAKPDSNRVPLDDDTLFTDEGSSDSDASIVNDRKKAESNESSEGPDNDEVGTAPTPSTPNSEVRRRAPVVTPDITRRTSETVTSSDADMEWVPIDFEFGSCVCGRVVPFCTEDSVVVVCGSCQEPMHVKCTAFASMEQILQETKKVVYKRRFFHDTKVCRICTEEQCPSCVTNAISAGRRKPLNSRATLIVTPSSILNQWEREIQRHTSVLAPLVKRNIVSDREQDGSAMNDLGALQQTSENDSRPLKVAIYCGVRELCHKGGKSKRTSTPNSTNNNLISDCGFNLIHPAQLADYDVVLLTFDTLMSDFGHSDENPYTVSSSELKASSGKVFRGKKRYRVVPSPLSAIDWWRVCLDEAQRVEATTATCAKMALKLVTQHRWCVSGTPIGKGKLDDLYGLLLFLRLQPFSEKPWFDKCFAQTHHGVGERIKHLLNSCFWRSTKSSDIVRTQMGVPEQTEWKVILRFSSIERHFYDRQLEQTLTIATDAAGSGTKRKASQLDQLSLHVHKLRAACCHPQVGSSGIGRLKKRRKTVGGQRLSGEGASDVGGGTVVLTMDQILDRLIDDARLKCEEAQRRTLMHTNAMASLAKLKVEAKQYGCKFNESDASLFLQSCKLYQESLDLTEENGKPSTVVGEAVLSGSKGFRSSHKIIRNGTAVLDWQIRSVSDDTGDFGDGLRQVWSRIDFEGPSKRVIEIRMRPLRCIPTDLADEDDSNREVVCPKDCLFQVSSSAVGGEFIDVCKLSFPQQIDTTGETGWTVTGGFRTNKSKSWRVVILNYHENKNLSRSGNAILYVGVEVELCEADIANDPLQRLHIMHNAILSSECLFQISQGPIENTTPWLSPTEIQRKIGQMQEECHKIESLYMDSARAVHHECQRRLLVATEARHEQDSLLMTLSRSVQKRHSDLSDCWADEWWSDLLIACSLHGTEHDQKSLCDLVRSELDSFLHGGFQGVFVGISTNRAKKTFPDFHDANGILTGLQLRMRDHRNQIPAGGHARCMTEIAGLSPNPTDAEMFENSRCRECKADWNQKGEVCRFCKMGKRLSELEPDRLLLTVLKALGMWVRGSRKSASLLSARTAAKIDERAKRFFDVLEASKKEISAAHRSWRTHLDLMNVLDELNMCKRTMRLAQEGEDLTLYTEQELVSIVSPIDLATRFHDHAAKQAMSLGNLRRQKDTLRYLKNQNQERLEDHDAKPAEDQTCTVCLSPLEGDRAVLLCGHSFHHSPCLERLMKRHGNHQAISCPLRCNVRTKRDEVMIASDKRNDDGSRSKRDIKGSWGTKVTRLVADVMDAADLGEKSIVFSMWEDMLEVVEQALAMNDVGFVRVKTLSRIGDSTRQFRRAECSVLLLNVKNGAEGLTLVEATHVFMVEPLLNCGLDSQGMFAMVCFTI
jgi:E3 ubiquitin-protein ligase SHPRH